MILILTWSNFTEIVLHEYNASMNFFQFIPPPEQFPSQIYPLLDWWTHSECCERKFFISDSILIILRMENLHWRLMKFKLGVSFYKLFITGLPSAKPFQSWSFHQKIKGQKGAVWILKDQTNTWFPVSWWWDRCAEAFELQDRQLPCRLKTIENLLGRAWKSFQAWKFGKAGRASDQISLCV